MAAVMGFRQMSPEQIRERDARFAQEDAAYAARHQRLVEAAAGNAALLAVIELHRPSRAPWHECEGCDFGGWEADAPEYPCSTIQLLEEHYHLAPETIAGELAPPGIAP